MNDEKEIRHATELVKGYLDHYLEKGGIQEWTARREALSPINHLGDLVLGQCVCSFSEDGDLLSQWRAYGADGRGLCLGVNSSLLRQDAEAAGFSLGKCIYDHGLQSQICMSFLDEILRPFDPQDIVRHFPEELKSEIENFIYTVGLFLKHPAFIDEREWRLVSGPNHLYSSLWNYRATPSGLSSYIALRLDKVLSKESETEPPENVPHIQFTRGPKSRRSPTNQILQALSYRVVGKGYGVNQSAAPYVD